MNTAKQQTPGAENRPVGIYRKMSRNYRTLARFTKQDWLHGPIENWGWGYAWGYRRAQYHFIERLERCLFGRNRLYGRRGDNGSSSPGQKQQGQRTVKATVKTSK